MRYNEKNATIVPKISTISCTYKNFLFITYSPYYEFPKLSNSHCYHLSMVIPCDCEEVYKFSINGGDFMKKKYVLTGIALVLVIVVVRVSIDLYNVDPPTRDITAQMKSVMGNKSRAKKISFDKETLEFLTNNTAKKVEPTDAQGWVGNKWGYYGVTINGHDFTALIESDQHSTLRYKIFPKRSIVKISSDKNFQKLLDWGNR